MPDEDQLFLYQREPPRFEECLKLKPGDGPSARFSKRVGMLRANPPPPDWNGV
jgi:hypothetical protein